MSGTIQQFGSVDLAEVLRRASLLQRVDRKYLVPLPALEPVLADLPRDTQVLEIDGSRSFRYRSVYFDTADLLSYRLTALRRRRRFKIRTRSYLDDEHHLLEIKTRGPRGITVKQRVRYAGDGRSLRSADRTAVITALREVGIDLSGDLELQPVLVSHYRRSTLLLADDSRTTIDTVVSWSPEVESPHRSMGPYAIVETKTSGRSGPMDRALWSRRYRPSSFSKFGTGLATIRPELAAHRWRPVLDRCSTQRHHPYEETSP